MADVEKIMDHEFVNGFCQKCGRKRWDVVSYGHPDIVLTPGPIGLSCSGSTNESEIASVRAAWRKDREKWDKISP